MRTGMKKLTWRGGPKIDHLISQARVLTVAEKTVNFIFVDRLL